MTNVNESARCSCGFFGCHDVRCSRNVQLAKQRDKKERYRKAFGLEQATKILAAVALAGCSGALEREDHGRGGLRAGRLARLRVVSDLG